MAIVKLPNWVLTSEQPAFYDSESGTAIEMVARIYGKMNELVEEYNLFADSVNLSIENFMNESNDNIELFKVDIRQEFQDFIDIINLKMLDLQSDFNEFLESADSKFEDQNNRINNAINYMKNNIETITKTIVNESLSNQEIKVTTVYDSTTKSVDFLFTN